MPSKSPYEGEKINLDCLEKLGKIWTVPMFQLLFFFWSGFCCEFVFLHIFGLFLHFQVYFFLCFFFCRKSEKKVLFFFLGGPVKITYEIQKSTLIVRKKKEKRWTVRMFQSFFVGVYSAMAADDLFFQSFSDFQFFIFFVFVF